MVSYLVTAYSPPPSGLWPPVRPGAGKYNIYATIISMA
jgi:hypothetical protein